MARSETESRALKPAKFWRDNSLKYPLIYKLSLLYASVPTSSVAADRSFGIMRAVEMPNKLRQKDAAWRAEIFLRYNQWLVERKWREVAALVTKMQARTTGGSAATPATYFGPPH